MVIVMGVVLVMLLLLLLSVVGFVLLGMAIRVLEVLWWGPKRIEAHFAKQGIRGPPYRFFMGNVKEMVGIMLASNSNPMATQNPHNILPRVLSFYTHWKKIYGSTFLLWFGPTARLTIADPDLIREVMRSEIFDRYESHPLVRQLEGEGLVNLRGDKWAHHRKVLTPAFYMDNLKLLVPLVGKTVLDMVEKLTVKTLSQEVEVDVSEWFQGVTEDAITRTAFGRSYDDGKSVFKLQARQMVFAAEAFQRVLIPGYRFIPTEKNMNTWKLEKEIKKRLATLINIRNENLSEEKGGDDEGKDLLGLLINARAKWVGSEKSGPNPISVHDIIEECKTFFFAGKQTTSNLLTWITVMLAMHPDWQHKARDEVLQVCGSRDIPTKDQLSKLKTLGMILNETLRLYPPAVATIRRAKADVELGGYQIPVGTELLIPIMAVHHDTRFWGPDATQFNPTRFADGVARAARCPNAFIPFGLGARMCIGQNLAVLETKLTIAILLQRFSFRLSPSYVHAPTVLMLLYPKYGAPVIFRKLPQPDNNAKQFS